MHLSDMSRTELYRALGLKDGNAKLPDQWSEKSVVIGEVDVWIIDKDEARRRGLFHRVRCLCPVCLREMSAARFFQHRCA